MDERSLQDKIHICYCGNRKVFPMILLSALSILEHTASPLIIYLATMDLTEENSAYEPISKGQEALLDGLLKEKNAESRAVLIDAGEAYKKQFAKSKNAKNSYTPYAQLRLLLDELVEADRLIYLDVDIMCCSDIQSLWNVDVTGCEFGAVKDHMGKFWIARDYCNSGVLLLNMEYIRETDFFGRVIHRVCTHKMMMPDQTALNRLAGNKLILPRKFNEQRKIQKDTVLKHFCKGIKWLPFFRVYNIKQTERDKVRRRLKIHDFDGVYERYDEIALTYDIMEPREE